MLKASPVTFQIRLTVKVTEIGSLSLLSPPATYLSKHFGLLILR